MFSQHTGDMGVVMLDADFLRNVCIQGVFCGQVFGVQVVGDGLWIDIEEALVMFNALAERGQGLQILQVSDMMADKGLSPLAYAKGVFEMTTAGQEWQWQFTR